MKINLLAHMPKNILQEFKRHDSTLKDNDVATTIRPISSIKLGAGGLELSSQVIGLIVLALSFGFFFLYIKEVYPMVEAATHAAVGAAK
jgi:hypothetical protein